MQAQRSSRTGTTGGQEALILDALAARVALVDQQGVITYANAAWRSFAETLGSPGWATGDDYLRACDCAGAGRACEVQPVGAGIRAVLSGAQPDFSIDYLCRFSTEERWLRLRVTRSAEGKGAVLTQSDVTEHIRAKDQLRESERRFRDMLDNVELATVMLDTQARITYCNGFLLALTGWQLHEVLGRDWFELFMPAELGDMRPIFESLLGNSPDAWHREQELFTRSRERRMFRWNNSLLRSASGEVTGVASIGEDITDGRLAMDVLAQRAEQLERFHRLSVGRELQMIELKKQVNALATQLGQALPHDLGFLAQGA